MSEYWGDITESERKWKEAKWSMFSASNMYHLCIGKKATKTEPAKLFGDGAKTYIKEVAMQSCTILNDRDEVRTKAMQNGNIDEPEGFAHFVKVTGLTDLTYCGVDNKIFKKYCDNSGASPDSVSLKENGDAYYGAEGKCRTGKVHFDHLLEIGDREDLLRIHQFESWVQCQFNMMAFNAPYWFFYYYNSSFKKFNLKMKITQVNADKTFQSDLSFRLKQAIIIKDKIITLLNEGYVGDISHLFN